MSPCVRLGAGKSKVKGRDPSLLGVRNLLMVPRGNESVFSLSTEASVSVSVGLPRDKVMHTDSAFMCVVSCDFENHLEQ